MNPLDFFYLKCFMLSCVGWWLNNVLKMNGVRAKSLKGNLEWSYKKYLYDEVWSIVGNFTAVVIVMFFVKDLRTETGKEWVTLIVVLLTGFVGSELIIRVLGTANTKVNQALSYKAKIADESNNNTDNPTPVK